MMHKAGVKCGCVDCRPMFKDSDNPTAIARILLRRLPSMPEDAPELKRKKIEKRHSNQYILPEINKKIYKWWGKNYILPKNKKHPHWGIQFKNRKDVESFQEFLKSQSIEKPFFPCKLNKFFGWERRNASGFQIFMNDKEFLKFFNALT